MPIERYRTRAASSEGKLEAQSAAVKYEEEVIGRLHSLEIRFVTGYVKLYRESITAFMDPFSLLLWRNKPIKAKLRAP